MSDWREADGDEWGPKTFAIGERESDVIEVSVSTDGLVVYGADSNCSEATETTVPHWVIRALLRAHDLRTKAPGTECPGPPGLWPCDSGMVLSGDGSAERPFVGPSVPCPTCHGSSRNLTSDELKRWKERK